MSPSVVNYKQALQQEQQVLQALSDGIIDLTLSPSRKKEMTRSASSGPVLSKEKYERHHQQQQQQVLPHEIISVRLIARRKKQVRWAPDTVDNEPVQRKATRRLRSRTSASGGEDRRWDLRKAVDSRSTEAPPTKKVRLAAAFRTGNNEQTCSNSNISSSSVSESHESIFSTEVHFARLFKTVDNVPHAMIPKSLLPRQRS